MMFSPGRWTIQHLTTFFLLGCVYAAFTSRANANPPAPPVADIPVTVTEPVADIVFLNGPPYQMWICVRIPKGSWPFGQKPDRIKIEFKMADGGPNTPHDLVIGLDHVDDDGNPTGCKNAPLDRLGEMELILQPQKGDENPIGGPTEKTITTHPNPIIPIDPPGPPV